MLKNITLFALIFLFIPILSSAFSRQYSAPVTLPAYQNQPPEPAPAKLQFHRFPKQAIKFYANACPLNGCGPSSHKIPAPDSPPPAVTGEADREVQAAGSEDAAKAIYKNIEVKDTLDTLINELDSIKSITNQ